MKTMKVAVIGCGSIASARHIPGYHANARAEIKYLIDPARERAEELAARYGVPHVSDDLQVVLDDPEVEAVSLCTPNRLHASLSAACLNAGKHVLCEKPAAMNLAEARQMQAAAARSNRVLNIGFVNRYNTAVNRIKQMIDDGELGNVYHIYCSFRAHRSIPGLGGPFTTRAQSGGGVLIDWGVHFLDLIFYSLGRLEVEAVSGAVYGAMAQDMRSYAYVDMWAGPPDYDGINDVEDFVTGLLRTSGPTISLNGAWAQNIGESAMYVEFLGDKAGVKLEYGGGFKVYSSGGGMLLETVPSFPKTDMFHDEIDDFLQSAASNTKGRAHIDQTILTSQVVDAIYESAMQGKEVRL